MYIYICLWLLDLSSNEETFEKTKPADGDL